MQNRQTTYLLFFIAFLSIQGLSLCATNGKELKLEQYGVSFRPPSNWIAPEPKRQMVEYMRNLGKKEDVRAFTASHRGTIPIATYFRYDPRNYAGMILTINILARPNDNKTFEQFRQVIEAGSLSWATVFRNYVVRAAPTEKILAGRRIVVFSSEYNLSTARGNDYRVANTTYAIPCGDIFLQICLVDSISAEHDRDFKLFMESFSFKEP